MLVKVMFVLQVIEVLLVHIMAIVSITNGNPNYNTSGVIILPVHTLTHSLYFAREKSAASDTLIIPYQEIY